MNWYGDTLTWYLDSYLEHTLPFFTRIIGATQGTDYNCLDIPDSSGNWIPLRTQQRTWVNITSFSVEQLGHDRLVVSFDIPAASYTPSSIAFISEADGESVLVAKLVLGSQYPVSRTIKRVLNLQLPYTGEGNVHTLPRYYLNSVRMTDSPFGGEYVMVDEHHHSTTYQRQGQASVNDTYPVGLSSSRNFMESAQLYTSDITGTASQPSYVYGEVGRLQTDHSDMTGQRTTGSDFLSGKRDRNLSNADIILNLLEVLIMANNKIQILGKAITTEVPPTGSAPNRYVLVSDTTAAGDNRNLTALSYKAVLGSITKKYDGIPSSLETSVNVIETSSGGTLSFAIDPAIAIVFNTKGFSGSSQRSQNAISINGVSIPPGDCAVFWRSGSAVDGAVVTSGVNNAIAQIMAGTYGTFDHIDVAKAVNAATVSASTSVSTATVNSTNVNVDNIASRTSANPVKINDTLSVGGKLTVTTGGMDVTGTTTLDATTMAGKLTVTTGGMDVTGTATFDAATIDGKLTVTTGGASITGATSIGGKLTVTTGGMDVTGDTTLDATTVGGDLSVTGNTTIAGYLSANYTVLSEVRVGTTSSYVSLTRASDGKLNVSAAVQSPNGFYVG